MFLSSFVSKEFSSTVHIRYFNSRSCQREVLSCTVLYCTRTVVVQCCILDYFLLLPCCTITKALVEGYWYCTGTALYCTLRTVRSTVLYCTVLYCTARYTLRLTCSCSYCCCSWLALYIISWALSPPPRHRDGAPCKNGTRGVAVALIVLCCFRRESHFRPPTSDLPNCACLRVWVLSVGSSLGTCSGDNPRRSRSF